MSHIPIITFKAGVVDLDKGSKPYKAKPQPTPGYISLYKEDDLPHFTWRPRNLPLDQAPLDLILFPDDAVFTRYTGKDSAGAEESTPFTNGRIYVLRFQSSSSRHLFWLQSKSQHPRGLPSWFSPRDLKLGHIINQLINGEEVNVEEEIQSFNDGNGHDGDGDGDEDEAMEDADNTNYGTDHHRAASGGAGAGATGGDIREEGEGAREGGADGGRAAAPPTDAQAAVANFLKSLQGNQSIAQGPKGKTFTTLPDLLQPSTTVPVIESTAEARIDGLLSHVPPVLLLLEQDVEDVATVNPDSDTVKAVTAALTHDQKVDILRRVLRSPQFSQSLGSLTMAIRDGGLPSIADALKIKLPNGGFMARGRVPLGGGEAVEAFLNGIKTVVEAEEEEEEEEENKQVKERMDMT